MLKGLSNLFGGGVAPREKIEITPFSVQMTQRVPLPDEEYIREIAKKHSLSFGKDIPLLWKDLYTLFKALDQRGSAFNVKDHIFSQTDVLDLTGETVLSGTVQQYYESTRNFLLKINYDEVPGATPLIQAFNVLSFVTSVKGGNDYNTPEDSLILQNYIKEVDEAIINKSVTTQFDLDTKDSGNADLNQISKTLSKTYESHMRTGLYDLNPVIKTVIQEDPEQSIPTNSAFIKLIKVKQVMDKKLGDALGSHTDIELNNSSSTTEQRRITSTAHALKAPISQKIMPGFTEKAIKKELAVKTKVAPKKTKQSAIIAVDDSGSMATLWKQSYVRAILLKLLEDVANGDMELVFYNYVTSLYNRWEVTTMDDCKKLFDHVNKRIPSGGGTNIGACIQTLVNEVIANKDLINPEIFIVCDGEDHVDASKIDFKGVKVNFISLGNYRGEHKKVSDLSGGTYISESFNDSGRDYNLTAGNSKTSDGKSYVAKLPKGMQ